MKAVSKATILALLAAAALFFTAAPAQADSYVDYQIVNGVFQSGFGLSGWFVIDTNTGAVTNGQITADQQSFGCPDGFSNGCVLSSSVGFMTGPGAPTSYSFLQLTWSPSAPASGFDFNLSSSYCAYCATGSYDYLVSGSVVNFGSLANPVFSQDGPDDGPVGTPEPNSGILLFSGLIVLGLVGLKHRGAINNA